MIAVITANLGGVDREIKHVDQSLAYDLRIFTDENFYQRDKSMTPRLQAKIPKCFAWQFYNHDTFLWLDASLQLSHPDSLKYFYDRLSGYDIVVLRHPARPNIRQEVRYTRKGVDQKSIYMHSRYANEWYQELYNEIKADKDYEDDLLVIGGCFMYRNTPKVREMLKEWWYYQSRYLIQDQISFAYVLKKSGVKYKVLDDDFMKTPYLKVHKHKKRNI